MGVKTEEQCTGLRLQLGKGADPWFDYSKASYKPSSKKTFKPIQAKQRPQRSENSYAFRALGRDHRAKPAAPLLRYRVRYSQVHPRVCCRKFQPPSTKKERPAVDLHYDITPTDKPKVRSFDAYSNRPAPGRESSWEVRDPVGGGLNPKSAVSLKHQLPRSYYDSSLFSYFEPGKYPLPAPAPKVRLFKHMYRPGDRRVSPTLRSSDLQPSLAGPEPAPIYFGERNPKRAPANLATLIEEINPKPKHPFY